MKQLILFSAFGFCLLAACNNHNTEKEAIIKAYFSGWEKKNWNLVEQQLAPSFTFTSPNNDDHLPIRAFRDKCWEQATHVDHVAFERFAVTDSGCYVTYQLFTKEKASFRNTEYFMFSDGKISSIEVFFGRGEGAEGFPSNKK